ncbi:CHAT domain-containing protein [Daldinia loculata]|uniref:CHAT domain-containing protein n=1 Tax=Daldinia loculata TaxID=103429 RepID=UPI0020C33EA2|nr:CHAT domain-containing protein [Daldinia loculata]KAI1649557.1 CHAT domain-containing protein [Daldinia loculata]
MLSHNQALLVPIHTTPGQEILEFAEDEVNILRKVCPSLQLRPVTPPPRKSDIIKALSECKIFHFAGHGKSKPIEPSQSILMLQDWQSNPLTVEDLREHKLQENRSFLGYLLASSTGPNTTGKLADEAIHRVGTLQLAGFRHVVGTLWKVSDKHCADVARILYETLQAEGMTDIAVC